MSDTIGDLLEKKMSFVWPVPGFFSLSSEVDKEYRSPVVFFAGDAWQLSLYPNESWDRTEGYISLYLNRRSSGTPKIVDYSIGLRNRNGQEENVLTLSNTFEKEGDGYGDAVLERSDLLIRKAQLVPEDTLTVVCTLSVEEGDISDDSLTSRLWNLSLNLKTVMLAREDADVKLKLPDGELDTHKIILKARSSVLGCMFSHDGLKECQTGEVQIEEGDTESFKVVLAYMYTGNPGGLSSENAQNVYKISHKYDLHDLTRCCSEFMRAGLSVETICDAVRIADLYEDRKLKRQVRDYFVEHKDEIRNTDQWKTLKEENLKIVHELVEYALDKK